MRPLDSRVHVRHFQGKGGGFVDAVQSDDDAQDTDDRFDEEDENVSE